MIRGHLRWRSASETALSARLLSGSELVVALGN